MRTDENKGKIEQPNGLKCLICGKDLKGMQRCYCSAACGRKAFRQKTQKPKAETAPPKPKISKAAKEKRFQKTVAEANKRGISYGQLKALEYIENNKGFTM